MTPSTEIGTIDVIYLLSSFALFTILFLLEKAIYSQFLYKKKGIIESRTVGLIGGQLGFLREYLFDSKINLIIWGLSRIIAPAIVFICMLRTGWGW